MTDPGDIAPAPLSSEEFQRLSLVSRETMARLGAYLELLKRWQKAINLVSNASLVDPWRRHFLDSAQLLGHIQKATGGTAKIADLGSGAGFPGLVLAILGVGEVHLTESDARKCAFLREAVRITETNAVVHEGRIETIDPIGAGIVTARALAPLPKLLEMAARHRQPGGICVFLKGKNVDEELTEAQKGWSMKLEKCVNQAESNGWILYIAELARIQHNG